MTYKDFFEKAKTHKLMQKLIIQCFITATNLIVRTNSKIDIGDLVLTTLSSLTDAYFNIKLTNKEEITAEYMAEVVNMYSENLSK